jgi:PIN domain nuclease of toxin-antitoxin system
MAEVVLDTSALLAFVWREQGAEVVARCIGDSVISTVNFSEAISKLVDRGASLEAARMTLGIAPPDVIDFDQTLAEQTGGLIARTRQFGLSLGDRACLALAAREGLPALTGDRIWSGLDIGVEIRLIR